MRSGVLKTYVGLVDAAALLALFLVPHDGLGRRPGTLLTLLVLSLLIGLKPVRVPALRIQIVALDLFVLCALITLAPLAAPLVALVAVASAVLGPGRRPLSMRTAFNLGVIPLSASAAALTYGRFVTETMSMVERHAVPLLAATAAYFVVNTALTAVAIALDTRRNVFAVWWGYALWNGASTFACMLMALGLAVMMTALGPAVLVLGLVAVLPILAQGKLKAMEAATAG